MMQKTNEFFQMALSEHVDKKYNICEFKDIHIPELPFPDIVSEYDTAYYDSSRNIINLPHPSFSTGTLAHEMHHWHNQRIIHPLVYKQNNHLNFIEQSLLIAGNEVSAYTIQHMNTYNYTITESTIVNAIKWALNKTRAKNSTILYPFQNALTSLLFILSDGHDTMPSRDWATQAAQRIKNTQALNNTFNIPLLHAAMRYMFSASDNVCLFDYMSKQNLIEFYHAMYNKPSVKYGPQIRNAAIRTMCIINKEFRRAMLQR